MSLLTFLLISVAGALPLSPPCPPLRPLGCAASPLVASSPLEERRCDAALPAESVRYCDAALPVAARVSALLDAMTVDEQIAQTFLRYPCASGPCTSAVFVVPDVDLANTGVGYVSIRAVTNRTGATPLESLRVRNVLATALVASSRLHIPPSWEEEGLHSGAWGGTLFAGPAGMGASWDAPLAAAIGAAIAVEARAAGVDTVYAPEVNMFDPRSGRYSEGLSEDAALTAALGAAMVRGLQGGGRAPEGPAAYLPSSNSSVVALAKVGSALHATRWW